MLCFMEENMELVLRYIRVSSRQTPIVDLGKESDNRELRYLDDDDKECFIFNGEDL